MDYEKAYKEALERARAGKPMDEVLPELKESEDERIREAIEGAIRVYGKTQGEWIGGYDMDTLVVHLREAFGALEKQKEQRPADIAPNQFDGIAYGMSGASTEHSKEWSEEYEKMFTDISWAIRYCGYDDIRKGRLNNCLKTLYLHFHPKPHWKPSEEQMEALSYVKEYFKDVPSAKKKYVFLVQLYDDLKKLL